MSLKITSRWVRSACVAVLGAGLLTANALGAGNQLLVTAANSIGNSVYDLTESPNSPLIGAAAAINTDGARHGHFDSIVWLNNTAKGSLDLLVADDLNRQILRYAGPNYGTASIVYTWPSIGHTAPEPNALSVDGAGNLFVVTTSGNTTPSLWVLPVNSAGVYGTPVLIDDRFGGVRTLLIADTVIASTTTSLWNTGDLLVLVADSFDPRVLVYASSAIAHVIAHPTAPLTGPSSTAVSFETFLRERAVPAGMDQWPADATHGESLLFSTTDGRILRYDTKARAFASPVASGLGAGLQKLKAGLYANVSYAFVAQVLPHNAGRVLQFQPPPASGANPPVATISAGLSDPMGLAVTQTDTTAAANCVAPNTCNLLSDAISVNITGPGAANVSGTVVTQSCIVPSDPRVSYPGGIWTCNGAETLNVANYCPGFPNTILPGTLCGHAGSSGSGFAVIKGTADGIDPFDNDAFIYTLADITALLPGGNDLGCSPLGALAWAPRSDLTGIEGTIVEDATSPFFIELTGYCDKSGDVDRGNSMFALGVAVNTAPAAMPTGLPGYVTSKYNNLSATIADANIASATASTLQSCVSTSQSDFNSGVAGAANGFSCAVYQAVQCDNFVRNNLGSFSSNLTPTGGNPNPAGEIDGRLANLFLTINTRVAGNPPNPNWPAADVPACVDLTAPASVAAGSSGTLSWSAAGVPSTSHCALSSSDGHFNNTPEPASGSASTGVLTNAGSSITYDLSCPGAGAGTGLAAAVITVTAVPPNVTIQATPSTIDLTGSSTLSWSTTNATVCTASGGWSGAQATSGSLLVAPNATTTYTLSCTGPGGGGTVSNSATVTVSARPTVSVAAAPTSIAYGASTTLSWTSTGATSCSASGGWSGTEPTSSAGVTVSPMTTTTYSLTCSGPGGASSAPSSVEVSVAPPPATVNSFTSSAPTTGVGNQLNLTWTTTAATSCTLSASDGNYTAATPVATSGTALTGVLTQVTTTYQAQLSCLPAGPNSTAFVNVNVLAPIPLNNPGGLAIASNGNLYVANEGQIQSEGIPQVNGQVLVYAPNTPGSNGQIIQQPQLSIGSPLQNPVALAFDSQGNLYVADAGLNEVLVFNSAGIQQTGATLTICSDCGTVFISAVAVDNSGVVYVSLNGDSALIQGFAYSTPLQNPQEVAYWFNDSSGTYFAGISALNFDGTYVWAAIDGGSGSELAAYTPAALTATSGTLQVSQTITNSVSGAAGIAFDPRSATRGNIFLADSQWQSSETLPITIYSAANSYSYITPSFNDGANPALNTPAGIAIDSSGDVYVADSNNGAIDVYSAAALAYEYSPKPTASLSAKVGGVAIASGASAETLGTQVTYSWSAVGVPAGGTCTVYDNQDTPATFSGLELSGSITLPIPITGEYEVFVSCSYDGVPFTPSPGFTIFVPTPNVAITASVNGASIANGTSEPSDTLVTYEWVATGLPTGSTCNWSATYGGYNNGDPLVDILGLQVPTPDTLTVTCGNGTYSATGSFTVN